MVKAGRIRLRQGRQDESAGDKAGRMDQIRQGRWTKHGDDKQKMVPKQGRCFKMSSQLRPRCWDQ